jgi:hypothetical protein
LWTRPPDAVRLRPFDSKKANDRLVWRGRVATARLTLFFVAIVVLPVAVATAYGWQRIPVGQGVAGTVAATGRAMVLASPAGNGGPEPTATT